MSSTSGIYLDCRLICVVSTLARFTFGKELAWCLAVTLTRGQLRQTARNAATATGAHLTHERYSSALMFDTSPVQKRVTKGNALQNVIVVGMQYLFAPPSDHIPLSRAVELRPWYPTDPTIRLQSSAPYRKE
jgi:hypothetical protein